ncbi:MAG: hypothetical protein AAGC60_11000 [Acidobacteriota bacterium]
MSEQASALLEKILSGENRNLQVLAAQGLVPLPPEELIPIQVALVGSPDGEISGHARQTLAQVDTGIAVNFIQRQAGEAELLYFGAQGASSTVVEAVLRRQDVPRGVLLELAAGLSGELQEILILRQDAILDEPKILVELEGNPQLTNYVRRRIWEYREHLLPRDKVPPKKAEEIVAEADALTDEAMQEAVAEVKEKTGEADDDAVIDDRTGLSEVQIRQLPVPMRVKLARNADKQTRMVLVRDANSTVAVTVMTANSIPDSEVEQIANNRSVHEDALAEIPKKREWIRKYSIARALVKNPKTRQPIAMKLVPRMTVRDLRELAKDKNIPDGVRTMALRLYQTKR